MCKGYNCLLIGMDHMEGFDEVPTQAKYDQNVGSSSASSQKVREFYHLNKITFKDLIILDENKSKPGKIAFWLIKNHMTEENPERVCAFCT